MKKIVFIFALVVTFFLAGCANGTESISSPESAEKTTGTKVNVYSSSNFLNFSSSSKMIVPESYDCNSELRFFIWGKDLIDSDDLPVTEITITASDSANEGTFEYNFTRTEYRLTLVAVPNSVTSYKSGDNTEVLTGSTIVDFKNSPEEFSIRLSPYSIAYKGTIKLSIFTLGWNPSAVTGMSVTGVTAYIYKTDDSSQTPVLQKTDFGLNIGYYASEADLPSNVSDYNYNFYDKTITPGTYTLVVAFTVQLQNGTIKTYSYTDNVVILANRETVGQIKIPDILDKIPDSPSEFIAGYDSLDTSSSYYSVEFSWTDKSLNETGFELQLLDVSAVTPSTSYSNYNDYLIHFDEFTAGSPDASISDMDSYWTGLAGVLGYDKQQTFKKSYDSFVEGDLNKITGSDILKHVVMKLPYGKKYLARIRAVSEYGWSDYCYCDFTNTGSSTFDTSSTGSTFVAWESGSVAINRYYVSYYFIDGKLYDTSSGSKTEVTDPVTKYYSVQLPESSSGYQVRQGSDWNGDGNVKLICHNDDTSSDYDWDKWTVGSQNGNDAVSEYKGSENYSLFAVYSGVDSSDAETTYTLGTDYFVRAASATDTADKTSVDDRATVSSDITSTVDSQLNFNVSKSSYAYVYFLFKGNSNDGIEFSYSKVGGASKSVNAISKSFDLKYYQTAEINISSMNVNDVYKIIIKKDTANGSYNIPFTMTIKE